MLLQVNVFDENKIKTDTTITVIKLVFISYLLCYYIKYFV